MKAQGALEYLLLIGGAVLLAVIVLIILTSSADSGLSNSIENGSTVISNSLQNAIDDVGGGSGTGCVNDEDCDSWKNCTAGTCTLRVGRCDTPDDCSPGQTCSSNHKCEGSSLPGL
ncbi:MAG: class III signal peptide-containing protein [Candidatus Diapherotrites archaeon]